jgi:hypothetical protein
MVRPSLAQEFFKRLIEKANSPETFDRIKELVSRRTPESEWLEFKGADAATHEDELKAKWSKALSAFANTDGGVIWGVRAKRGLDGIDAADAAELAPH